MSLSFVSPPRLVVDFFILQFILEIRFLDYASIVCPQARHTQALLRTFLLLYSSAPLFGSCAPPCAD